jgi:hypothetical protein
VIVRSAYLTGIDQLGMRRGEVKKLLVGEVILDHNVSERDTLSPPDRDQSGITGTGAYEVYVAFAHVLSNEP